MSELRSAIEGFRGEALAELPDARIEEDFLELQRAAELIELERLRRLAEIDRRKLCTRDGHLSVASWLSNRCGLAWGEARRDAGLARSLEEMAGTRRALESGELSLAAARALAAARQVDPEAFEQAEGSLVEAARRSGPTDLRRVLAHWRARTESQRLGTHGFEERVRSERSLHASVTFGGMVRLDGDLDPETGETFMTALGAMLDAEARSRSAEDPDDRTPAQRRADALGEICRGWLEGADRPSVAGERPHFTVTIDAGVLRGDAAAGLGELDRTGPISPQIARRLACDASVMRVVRAGASEPLDVGRRTPVVPPAMRRAVVVRDRHCRFPGCDRPHTWCDAHHVVHWADGGATAMSNLLLLCRRHHRMVHGRGGFSLEMLGGRAVFRRPDGSVLQDRGPP